MTKFINLACMSEQRCNSPTKRGLASRMFGDRKRDALILIKTKWKRSGVFDFTKRNRNCPA